MQCTVSSAGMGTAYSKQVALHSYADAATQAIDSSRVSRLYGWSSRVPSSVAAVPGGAAAVFPHNLCMYADTLLLLLLQIRAELAEKELALLQKEQELLDKEQTLLVLKEEVRHSKGLLQWLQCSSYGN